MRLTRRDLIKGGLVSGTALLLPGAAGRAAAGALPSLRPGGPARVGPYLALAGSLHDHSTDSDGDSSSEAISTWVTARREELGIDYAILSDHSDFFPLSPFRTAAMPAADPTSSWVRQVALVAQSTCDDLTYLRAFEWTNDQENHLNVLFSQNWTSRAVTGDAAPFWTWFDTALITDPTGNGLGFGGGDGLGQFNHPGDKGALNWDDYAPDTVALQRMCTIEVHGDQGKGGRGTSDAGWYWFALAQGWLLGPVMNWDYHTWTGSGVLQASTPGSDYGVGGHLPGQRSVVFAGRNTTAGMREARAARRTCASEVPDGWAALTGPGASGWAPPSPPPRTAPWPSPSRRPAPPSSSPASKSWATAASARSPTTTATTTSTARRSCRSAGWTCPPVRPTATWGPATSSSTTATWPPAATPPARPASTPRRPAPRSRPRR